MLHVSSGMKVRNTMITKISQFVVQFSIYIIYVYTIHCADSLICRRYRNITQTRTKYQLLYETTKLIKLEFDCTVQFLVSSFKKETLCIKTQMCNTRLE